MESGPITGPCFCVASGNKGSLMSRGVYNEPTGAFLPSILF